MKYLIVILTIFATGCASFKRSQPVTPVEYFDTYCAIGSLPMGEHKMQVLSIANGSYKMKSQDGKIWYMPASNCLLKQSQEE